MDGSTDCAVEITFPSPLRELTVEQIVAIDEALCSLGRFGEVRLIKNKGRLRFIQKVVSKSFGSRDDRTWGPLGAKLNRVVVCLALAEVRNSRKPIRKQSCADRLLCLVEGCA